MRLFFSLGLAVSVSACLLVSCVLAGCSFEDQRRRDTPSVTYDPASGRLKEIAFDTTQNGRNDSRGFMDGTLIRRIEVDEDEDGRVDRWEFYDSKRRLERMGISRQHNGALDSMAFYGEAGDVVRIEISTRGDATFNRIEFYQFGSLARVEEDTNSDGRIDKWETYAVDPRATPGQRGPIVTAAFDDAFRGTPTRRFVYRPDGSGVLRVEVDPDGDGTFLESTAAGRDRRHGGRD